MSREIYTTIPAVCTDPKCPSRHSADGTTWAKYAPWGATRAVCTNREDGDECGADCVDTDGFFPFKASDFEHCS